MSALHTMLDGYQQFTVRTAVYPVELAKPYLGLGLGDEAGELLDKVVEFDRLPIPHHYAAGRNILAEVGDVCWYLAQSLLQRQVRFSDVYIAAFELTPAHDATLLGAAIEVSSAAAAFQGRLKKEIRDHKIDEASILHNAARVVRALDSIARFFGADLFRVVELNRAKLEDRLARDAIKGEGDVR